MCIMKFWRLDDRGFSAVEPGERQDGWAGDTPDEPKAAAFEIVGLDIIIPAANTASQPSCVV